MWDKLLSMTYDKKLNQFQIAQTNKYNVFRCLVQEGPINRAAIAKHLSLSIPTVMAIADDLFEKKIIRSEGKAGAGVGKQPELLAVEAGCFYYTGVDIGRSTIRITICSAAGEPVGSMKEPTGDPLPEKKFVAHVKKLMLRFVKKLKIESSRILGAGFAMPGLIGLGTGNVIFAPDFGWKDIPLRQWLQADLPYPVIVKNSTQAMAINEIYRLKGDRGSESHTTLCVNLGYGIGAALISGGKLYDGAGGISGELGHCLVAPEGPPCKCGNRGCLEAVSSGEAIARQAREAAVQDPQTAIMESCGGDVSRIDAKKVFEAASSGDTLAQRIVEKAAAYIGIGISMAVNILDCDRVVVCGGLMRNDPRFLDQIKAAMEEHLVARASRSIVLSAGASDEYSAARGASRILLDTLWTQRALPI
jgi:predicted NBD/HSP70 family sugar kinase